MIQWKYENTKQKKKAKAKTKTKQTKKRKKKKKEKSIYKLFTLSFSVSYKTEY